MSFGASVEYEDKVETESFDDIGSVLVWVSLGFKRGAKRVQIEVEAKMK